MRPMSDAPVNRFLFEFGIDEKSTRILTCRVTQIIAENMKISDKPGNDWLQCDIDKSACVRDIVRYIDCEDLTPIDAQWMFFAFGATIANNDMLRKIAQEEHTARELFEALTNQRLYPRETTQEE